MSLPFSLFLALKYLKPQRTFLSVVTLISIVGVMLGVGVLIIVLSVMSGFDDMWRDKILSFNSHLTVMTYDIMDADEDLLNSIESVEGVTGAAPYIQGLVFVEHGGQVLAPAVRGVDPEREVLVSEIPEHMVAGRFSVEYDEVVVGKDLALRLGVGVGSQILVYSPETFADLGEVRLPEELTVAGIFELGMWEFDMNFVITSLEKARELYAIEQGAHAIQVMTRNPFKLADVSGDLREVLGPQFAVKTWMDLNRQLFATLRVEKNMMFFLLIIITLVAAFGVMNTLITIAVQKTNEIGLLKALGFSSASVVRVFFWLGFTEGVMGSVSGIGFGLLVLRYRNDLLEWMSRRLGMELFPKEFYHLSQIPASTSAADVAWVATAAVLMCTLAAGVAAWRAARLDPVEALRYE